MSVTIRRAFRALFTLSLAALAACSGTNDPASRNPPDAGVFQEPTWWHHFHGDSRSTDRLPSMQEDAGAPLERAWSWQEGTAAFLGAVLSRDQKTLYVTSSEDPPAPNFHALDAETGRVLWTFPLDPWATFSGGLVGPDDMVYVADSRFVYAIRPPASPGAAPREIWRSPHRHVSLSLGFTPTGELFEVTLDGQVNIFHRGTGARLARIDALPGEKSLRPGVGIPDDLRVHPRLLSMGADVPAQMRTGMDGEEYLVPGHLVYLWDAMRETGLVASIPGLAEVFLDTCFGGVFVSNTPSIVKVKGDVARIFIATIGEFIPPVRPAASAKEETVYPVFGRDHPEASVRGAYTGYLQVIDWNRSRNTLEVLDPPIPMDAPSGTTAGIGPPDPGGQALVFLAGGNRLYAFRAGEADLFRIPREPKWIYNAGMEVAGSPTVFRGGEVDGAAEGAGPAVAVLAGFSGMSMVRDDPGGADCEVGACRLVYETNTLPYEGRRREAMEAGEPALVALGTSVPEAGARHTYVQFTEGPGAVNLFDLLGMFSYKGYLPLRSVLAVVETRTGEIVQRIEMDEAQVCDSALGTTGWVYAVHTSGIDQIKHVIYPDLFPKPRGGIVAFRPVSP